MNQQRPFNIAIDTMSGDYGLTTTLPAIFRLLKSDIHFAFTLFGDETMVKQWQHDYEPLLNEIQKQKVSFHICGQIVEMDEAPASALRHKRDSSMRRSIEAVEKNQADAIISCGNTGALMAIARSVLKMLPHVERPAIATFIPHEKGACLMLDLGANVDSSAEQLVQFASLGAAMFEATTMQKPTVGLLNIGEELIKGNAIMKQTSELLYEKKEILNLNFIGNIEGHEIFKGKADVIVTDGFAGNIALKVAEGTAKYVTSQLKQHILSSFYGTIIGLIGRPVFKSFAKKLDPKRYNGACLLGLNGIVVKAHGGSDAFSFYYALESTCKMVEQGLYEKTKKAVGNI